MAAPRTIAAGKNALRLKRNLLPVKFLTSVKLLSLKLQTKYPGFRVHPKAPTYTYRLADSSGTPESSERTRTNSSSLAKELHRLELQAPLFHGFCYCFSNLQRYFIASAL